MDTPATLWKRPASLALNDEARQPTAHVRSISRPRVLCSAMPHALHSAPTPQPTLPHETDACVMRKFGCGFFSLNTWIL